MTRKRRDRSWPPAPEPLPRPLVDNHTHLDHALEVADGFGWRERSPDGPARRGWTASPPSPTTWSGPRRRAWTGWCRSAATCPRSPGRTPAAWPGPARRRVLGGLAIHPNEAVLHAGIREIAPDGLDPDPRPHHATPLDEAIAEVARVAAANPRVRVIGETGLDHFRAGERGRAVQREAFRAHIALAKELGLVLQIHDRDAHAEVVEVLLADGAPERTVFHCYSGDGALADVCAEHGWYLSFAGPVGYPASADLRDALHRTPPERILLETDAPYLPPHPHRGRPNGPYLVALTAAQVAAELGRDLADLCDLVSRTSEELYGPW